MEFLKFSILVCLFSTFMGNADTIHYKKGRIRENVEVTKDTHEEIHYKEKDSEPIKIPSDAVERIEYGDAPYDFRDGMEALSKKKYEDAFYFFEKALTPPAGTRDWIHPYANFHLGRAYHLSAETSIDSNKYENAIAYYQKAISANPYNRFLRECYFYSAQCYLELKKFPQAREQLENLQKSSERNKTWYFSALLLQGHILVEEKKYRQAIEQYKKARDMGEGNQREEAQLALGHCHISQKEFREALDQFNSVEKSDDPRLKASAKNGIATCCLSQGDFIKARNVALEVIFHCQSAVEQQPNALFILGNCYEELANKETNSLQRAQSYYQLVKLGYPNSKWAYEATPKLQQLKSK